MKWIMILLVFLIGCSNQVIKIDEKPEAEQVNVDEFMKQKAINLCIERCNEYEGNLTSGPCLDGDIINNWACDVAHNPREDVDNLITNQCEKYRNGDSEFFVEVDDNCELIKTG